MSIIYDFKAIKAATLAFPNDRPQNVVEPKPEPESPAYSYSSGDLSDQPDYGMYAGYKVGENVLFNGSLHRITGVKDCGAGNFILEFDDLVLAGQV